MGLNETVSAERVHIGFFGVRNAGKSSLVNAVTGQRLSVVSDVEGTTTDPVRKAMELLPLGPVVIIDTAGIDDVGSLGELRVEKTMQVLSQTDIAVLVLDASREIDSYTANLKAELERRKIPCITAYTKADTITERKKLGENEIYVSAKTKEGITELKTMLGSIVRLRQNPKLLVRDLLSVGDTVVLVTPIDESAPKGRLILPQQMVLRDILDANATAVVCRETELAQTLDRLKTPPRMVITDSQAFGKVAEIVPRDVPLTSFSILLARYKGDLRQLIQGFAVLKNLQDGDRVLISEGCTHHRQCNDIGTVKMPTWIENYCGAKLQFHFTSGGEFPRELEQYRVIVHCGGCMLNEAEMKNRLATAEKSGVPMVNYGVAIAGMHGVLKRSVEIFPDILELL